jgi:hypothetical protein
MIVVWLWLAIAVSASAIVWLLVAYFLDKTDRWPVFITLFGLASIGATVGIIGGLSRVGVVGEIMAATLGLLGAVAVWIFAADHSKGTIVSVCVITFSLSLFIGYFEGASRRPFPESYIFWRKHCADKFADKDLINDPKTFAIMDHSIGKLCSGIFNNERNLILNN